MAEPPLGLGLSKEDVVRQVEVSEDGVPLVRAFADKVVSRLRDVEFEL